ncbi:MAG: hypothetical protein QW607_05295 [Desulfurococcaceae archaeon]
MGGSIPRRRKKDSDDEKSVLEKRVSRGKAGKKTSKSSYRKIDIDKLVNKWYSELSSFLGLDTLGLTDEQSVKIITDILSRFYSDASSTPTLDAVFKKIKKYSSEVYSIIAYHLLTNPGSLNDQQLEFVIVNGGRAVVEYISELYRIALKKNRIDLINYLEYVWEKYGLVSPIKCPKCGFRSIMSDYSCQVCGFVVNEDYVRRELDFENKFRIYVEEASVAELRDVMNLGFVLITDKGVFNPRFGHKLVFEKKIYFQIYLRSSDYVLINRELSSRELDI